MSSLPDIAADLPTPATEAADEDFVGVSATHLNWLRAGVLGANDGIVSIAATVLGVAAASTDIKPILIAGIAALVAGALSMAVGEYVSVSSQRDAEMVTARLRGLSHHEVELTNPWHAAVASLMAFFVGGVIPMLVVIGPWGGLMRSAATFGAVLVALVLTGWISARFSGAAVRRAVARNVIGGSLAMLVTFGIGSLVGLVV